MPDDEKDKTPPVELDTKVPEPDGIKGLWTFLHSSPSFRRVFYGTTGAFILAAAGTALVCSRVLGPDETHNPTLNGTAEKYFPELKQ